MAAGRFARTVCYQCGDRGHMAIDCERPIGIKKCYCCNQFCKHLAKECPHRDKDAITRLKDHRHVLAIARSFDWEPRDTIGAIDGWNDTNKTLFLRSTKDPSTRIDIYTTTRTIKTILNHPNSGLNSLFRPCCYHNRQRLEQILNNPRVHSGIGYRTERGSTWVCSLCKKRRNKEEFSKNQWHKKRKSNSAKCQQCT